jgi:hypothetical protein
MSCLEIISVALASAGGVRRAPPSHRAFALSRARSRHPVRNISPKRPDPPAHVHIESQHTLHEALGCFPESDRHPPTQPLRPTYLPAVAKQPVRISRLPEASHSVVSVANAVGTILLETANLPKPGGIALEFRDFIVRLVISRFSGAVTATVPFEPGR